MTAVDGNKRKWIAAYDKEREYFGTAPDPFKNWERSTMPETMASVQLQNATDVLYAGAGRAIADKFLHAAVDMIDRAVAEDKFRAEIVFKSAFPSNRGQALQIRAYAKALLGANLNVEDILQASQDCQEFWLSFGRSDWDSQNQAHVLSAARMALLAGDLRRAKEVLAVKRSMKWHAEEFELLKELVKAAEIELPVRNQSLVGRVRTHFDRVRDPDFNPDVYMNLPILRLEWGALVNKYFETGSRIEWGRVIELVSE